MNVAIIYGTGQGQTAKISRFIAEKLRQEDMDVDVFDGRTLPETFSTSSYDAVIVGASVQSGGFQRYMAEFVKRHISNLRDKPSAFFGVSMTEADPLNRTRAMNPINRFLKETGWQPDFIVSVAGSMSYLRRRWLMRLMWRRVPLPDAHVEYPSYEYTDWDAVDQFAREFAAVVHSRHMVGVAQ